MGRWLEKCIGFLMKFFFDESGRFAAPTDSSKLCASAVTGVVISEQHEDYIRREFEVFVAELDGNEVRDGEPKGSRLSDSSRERFCGFLESVTQRGVLIAPIFVDMSLISQDDGFFGGAGFSKHLASLARDADDESKRAELLSLATKFG